MWALWPWANYLAFLFINFLASKKTCFNFKMLKMPDLETEHPIEQGRTWKIYRCTWVDSDQSHRKEHMTLEMRNNLEKAASQLSLLLVSITVPQPTAPQCHGFHLPPGIIWDTVMMTKLDSSFLLPSLVARNSSSRDNADMSFQKPTAIIRINWGHKAEERLWGGQCAWGHFPPRKKFQKP